MYYVLDVLPLESTEDVMEVEAYPDVEHLSAWLLGTPLAYEVAEPIQISLDDSRPGRLPDFLDGAIPLMSDGLIEALRQAGVDNLDVYRAELRDSANNLVSDSYKAVNVIGALSAADMAASKTAPGMPVELIDTSFDSLVLDEAKVGGLLMFRLAEAVTTLLVHESVKEHLQRSGFDSLGFIRPEDWMT